MAIVVGKSDGARNLIQAQGRQARKMGGYLAHIVAETAEESKDNGICPAPSGGRAGPSSMLIRSLPGLAEDRRCGRPATPDITSRSIRPVEFARSHRRFEVFLRRARSRSASEGGRGLAFIGQPEFSGFLGKLIRTSRVKQAESAAFSRLCCANETKWVPLRLRAVMVTGAHGGLW